MRLRYKLVAALLSTGLASVALVGGVAYVSVNYKVDALRRDQAAEHFHTYMTAYLAEYGDWQTAIASETFERFVQRNEARIGLRRPEADDGAPRGSFERPFGDRPPFAGGQDRPPPPGAGRRPPHPDARPPFRFLLADDDFRVLLGGGRFPPGSLLPESLRAGARPILVDGKPVAYMSSEGPQAPTAQERQYLDALYTSLLAGIAAAAGLAALLGVLLGRRLSRSLSRLTGAVRGMQQGELRQQVPVQGRDEVAALATAFNAMSERLAQSHAELSASHQTIARQAEELRELSIRDALTGLYNRRHFDEQASTLHKQAVRYKRPLTMAICDIDHFKQINDRFSHACGDQVLQRVGAALRQHMRQSDLVARYGGEEFVLAFPETSGAQAAALCEKLRAVIASHPWHEVHPELKVTMSIGASDEVAAGGADAMLRKADAQLYKAKEAGRDRVSLA